jgi:hypothetical protein
MDKEIIEDKIRRWSEQKYSEKGNRSVMEKEEKKGFKPKEHAPVEVKKEEAPNVIELAQKQQ